MKLSQFHPCTIDRCDIAVDGRIFDIVVIHESLEARALVAPVAAGLVGKDDRTNLQRRVRLVRIAETNVLTIITII